MDRRFEPGVGGSRKIDFFTDGDDVESECISSLFGGGWSWASGSDGLSTERDGVLMITGGASVGVTVDVVEIVEWMR